jgi:hypothetical protein
MNDLAVIEDSKTSRIFEIMNTVENATDLIVGQIPTFSDEQIIEVCVWAKSQESAAYKIRGACAFELKNRVAIQVSLQVNSVNL